MTLQRSTTKTIVPKGLTDALDIAHAFPGAMSSLSNLIPDPGADGMWVCRPAALQATAFSPFSSPGFISALKVVGNVAYGLIATARNPGHDEPFIYNLVSGQFTAIGNVLPANTPVSPATSGAWVPPTVDIVGTKIIFTHPGFNFGAGFYIGWIDISNPIAPTWNAGNLTGLVQFTSLPTVVVQFSGRAYYVVSNSLVFSDAGNPTNCTLGTQVITLGLNLAITAAVGLPLTNQLQGGIIQSIMCFVGTTTIYQVTGDASSTTAPLQINQLNVSTGTYSQNSVCATPRGLCFASPEGLRFINYTAQISDPVGNNGKGVVKPIFNALVHSRVALAYAGDVIRVSLQNAGVASNPFQEYFMHLSLGRWSGPHTFPASLIQGYGSSFIEAPVGVPGGLWQSNAAPGVFDTYVENGAQLQWSMTTPLMPPSGEAMAELALQEMTANMALNSGDIYFFSFINPQGVTISSVQLTGQGAANLWGSIVWGTGYWGSTAPLYGPFQVMFNAPVVFKQAQFSMTGPSAQAVKVGSIDMRTEVLGYLL